MLEQLAIGARAVVLRTSLALGPLWRLAYSGFVRALVTWLRGVGPPGTSAYLRGSLAVRGAVWGLSDIDLILVLPDRLARGATRPVRRRFDSLCVRFPPLRKVVSVWLYQQESLHSAMAAGALTYGDGAGPDNALFTRVPGAPSAYTSLRARPGPYGPAREWRLISGPERRDFAVARPEGPWIDAWLDMQCWWRHAFRLAREPHGPHLGSLCVKVGVEPLRVWLWLARRRRVGPRFEVLDVAARYLPEEAETIGVLSRLREQLHRSPQAPVDETLGLLVRMSARMAAEATRAIEPYGSVEVELVGARRNGVHRPGPWAPGPLPTGDGTTVPLLDWRAVVIPGAGPGVLVPSPGDPARRATLAEAVEQERPGRQPALLHDDVLVLPTEDQRVGPPGRGAFRAVQCPASDPVSFALLREWPTARFPAVRGWSAWDEARRAIAEHAARLRLRTTEPRPLDEISQLFAAARAQLLARSLAAGRPRLCTDHEAVATELAEQGVAAAVPAKAALTVGHGQTDNAAVAAVAARLRAGIERLYDERDPTAA